jgi:hypothetical protein
MKYLVVALILVGAGGAALYLMRRGQPDRRPPPHAESRHALGMDHEMSTLLALYQAPEGATPCESAYNAFKASQDLAAARGPAAVAVVLKLAPREQFLARCDALPAEARPCLIPSYEVRHRPECAKLRPPQAVLDEMFVLRQMPPSHP